jgi:hypothetical protein
MALYDYLCECGVVTEARRGVDVESIPCPACGQPAKRQPVYQVAVLSSGLPTRAGRHSDTRRKRQQFRDWREASEEIENAYSQQEKEAGHPIQRPNYYEIGLERAKELRKAGVKSLSEVKR